jgi:hypothetical protein
MSGQLSLGRVNVICGPNESGKSAAANALQLAVTGRCEVGAQANNQAKLLSGSTAMASCTGRGVEASWALRGGKRHWEDPGTQKELPVSVDEFWKLTGAERLKLLVPEGALAEIQSRIAKLEAEKKRLKAIIDAVMPSTPEEYTGLPVDTLQQQLSDLDAKLSRHAAAKRNKDAVDQKAAQAALARDGLLVEKTKIDSLTQSLSEHQAELALISAQLAMYGEACRGEPRIIKAAREKGITFRTAVSQTLGLVSEALRWRGLDDSVITQLVALLPDELIQDIPGAVWQGAKCTGYKIDRAFDAVQGEAMQLSLSIETCKKNIAYLETVVSFTQAASAEDGVLSMDEFMQCTAKKDELLGMLNKANAWTTYEAMAAKTSAERVKANNELENVSKDLEAAKKEMTSKVDGLKDTVETLVNKYLTKVQLPPLSISISQTARGWSMDVTIGEIALEVMAKSRRLLYGICLLSAIQETSAATAPILIAECAEMQPSTLDRCIEAMNLRTKGNVVLEHWHAPSVKTNLITIGGQ